MKRILFVTCIIIIGLFIVMGCATTQELKSSISSKVSSITSTVDPALVNQVPADKREGFAKAEYDLNLATEKEKLATMKTELANLQKKKANYEEDLASNFKGEAENAYDAVKIKALISAGVGKKEDNEKTRKNVEEKKYKILADRAKIQSDINETKMRMEGKNTEIESMEKAIGEMKFEGGKVADKPAPAPSAVAPAKPADKPEAKSEPVKEEKK